MGEMWRELVADPVITDLRIIIEAGIYDFALEDLDTLPGLFQARSRSSIKSRLVSLLMSGDPGLSPSSPELGRATRFNLTLFGVTSESRFMTAGGRRAAAGRIYRPASPVSADGVRKHPSAKQPRGGPEWRLLAQLRDDINSQVTFVRSARRSSDSSAIPPAVARALASKWRALNHLVRNRPAEHEPVPADVQQAIKELSQPVDYILHTLVPSSRR